MTVYDYASKYLSRGYDHRNIFVVDNYTGEVLWDGVVPYLYYWEKCRNYSVIKSEHLGINSTDTIILAVKEM